MYFKLSLKYTIFFKENLLTQTILKSLSPVIFVHFYSNLKRKKIIIFCMQPQTGSFNKLSDFNG